MNGLQKLASNKPKGVNPALFILGWIFFGIVCLIVAGFLAMHSINLFSFVFPPDQQQWAWLGFGLTGIGLLGYIVGFLWLSHTYLQKVICVCMAFLCGIGEVLSALGGMRIEAWKRAGVQLTAQAVDSLLMIIGILAILHLFAVVIHFAGDAIMRLFAPELWARFGDHDADGTPNVVDPEYAASQPSLLNSPTPALPSPQNGHAPKIREYTLGELLGVLRVSSDDFRDTIGDAGSVMRAWELLNRDLPQDISYTNFRQLALSVNPPLGVNR